MILPDFAKDDLTDIFKVHAAKSHFLPLEKILLVGALLEGDRLSEADLTYCHFTARMLRENGLCLKPHFEASFINLYQTGEDFLAEPSPADLLVFCFLFQPQGKREQQEFRRHEFAFSELYREKNIWRDKARETQAKAIAVIGSHDCLSLDGSEFEGDDFVKVADDPTKFYHLLVRRDLLPGLNQN